VKIALQTPRPSQKHDERHDALDRPACTSVASRTVLAVHVDCLEATGSSERRAAYFDGVFKVAFRLAPRSRSSTTNEVVGGLCLLRSACVSTA
jgi:hypothetical protein